ncbi:alpha/beta hydrolase [Rhizobiales bacterium L72]|uniref:Alpha/beta hydrolase n=1 Tax=Propylenella binzhouense TaxID=2555902 RepID=A0A964T8Y6_9HYPH|nr:alpha/beta hydrolase [Propylenella binzhouense]
MLQRSEEPKSLALAAAAGGAALVALAFYHGRRARLAERRTPPVGAFLEVGGVRLHYFERGRGPALVLFHGNGSLIQDFLSSGLVARAARRYRVIVFDRPGYGFSARPRGRLWTPWAQADLLHAALARLGIGEAIVLGHSWGALVAASYALRFPAATRALVLASGYFYPSPRFDALLASPSAVPVLGDVLRCTVSPFIARAIWPLLMRRIFGPAPVPPSFAEFPRELALRPSQLRAAAAESALLVPAAARLARRYSGIRVPTVVIAGADDRMLDSRYQSAGVARAVPGSRLHLLPGVGHMVHQTAPDAVMAAIDEASAMAAVGSPAPSLPRSRRSPAG